MPKGKTGKKTEKKKQQSTGQISLSQMFEKLTNYRFLGLGIAVFYFIVMAIVSFSFHKVGDYGVETDFFWGYVPVAKDFLCSSFLSILFLRFNHFSYINTEYGNSLRLNSVIY